MARQSDINALIDAIVKQTVVLIAQLATTGGHRAPLAHIANQVFMGLVEEIQSQGVHQKVTADMFGMALRTYQRKCQRILESETEFGRSLWEAILRFIQEEGLVTRSEVMLRFKCDDEGTVRSILNDLVVSGLILKTGYSRGSRYRAARINEQVQTPDFNEAMISLVWVAIYHYSPVSSKDLFGMLSLDPAVMEQSLAVLMSDGRVSSYVDEDQILYKCDSYLIPFGDNVGWTAAVFDHYQAMVVALCSKLRSRSTASDGRDVIGGSTFTFDIWEGHPLENKVVSQLQDLRKQMSQLRSEVEVYNANHEPNDPSKRVVFYLGQNVISEEDEEAE